MNTLEQDKAIVEGAPEGATHIDENGLYWIEPERKANNAGWECIGVEIYGIDTDVFGLRAISDIKQIIKFKEENERLKEAIKSIISNDEINTGYEPSVSCFQRSIYEAKQLLEQVEDL